MKRLSRYLLKQNCFYMFACLGVGVGIYLLSDLFDRLDDFLEAGLGAAVIAEYFIVKTPLMISQLMPAVFLLSCVLQLSIMAGNRELLALQAGGVSFGNMVRFFALCGVAWFVVQLVFSQVVGVQGEERSRRIWKEQVRSVQLDRQALENVWFREGRQVVEVDRLWPQRGLGTGITVRVLTPDERRLARIITARTVTARPGEWVLSDADEFDPMAYSHQRSARLTLPLAQDPATFLVVDPAHDPATLPLWRLGGVIAQLEASGSNVEGLKTVWHMKLAYAFSIVVMGLLALALVSFRDSVYVNIALGLVVTFAFYAVFMVGVSAGQKGLLPPVVAVWTGNAVFGALALLRLAWHARPRG
ncbi:MAG: LptF/LptG family permease [Desulfovibrionaceae bacterium]